MKPLDEQYSESMFLTTHAWRTALDRQLRPRGFTLSRWLLLMHLSRNDGCTHRELAQSMGIEAASLVRLVDRMEKEGLLKRCGSNIDRRVKHLRLTELGTTQVENIKSTAAQLRARILAGIAPAEIESALTVMNKIRATLGALT